jgi:queuine tRNA-ribosyltransferase
MLTDSGEFQNFSLGYDGIANKTKGKGNCTIPKTLLKIDDNGAVWCPLNDQTRH